MLAAPLARPFLAAPPAPLPIAAPLFAPAFAPAPMYGSRFFTPFARPSYFIRGKRNSCLASCIALATSQLAAWPATSYSPYYQALYGPALAAAEPVVW
ncbi:unnamed protein product, partial [Mesorhabditis spiculigera]